MNSSLFTRTRLLLVASTLLLATLACSLFSGPDLPPTPAHVPPLENTAFPTAVEPTAAPPTAGPLAACPEPDAASGETLYSSSEAGLCFVVPQGFALTIEPDPSGLSLRLTGALRPEFNELGPANLTIELNGPAEGLDSAGYAARWLALYDYSEPPLVAQPFALQGATAMQVDNLPGFASQRALFLVANGYRYSLQLFPQPAGGGELEADAQRLWDVVIASLVFFPPSAPPQYTPAEQVCPAPQDGAQAYADPRYGYCLLFPTDFETVPDFEGRFEGGPVLESLNGFQNVRTSLTLGYAGPAPDATARALADPMIQAGTLRPEDVQETTIGGYPAVVFHLSQDPWVHRIGLVLVNGHQYSLVAQPVEPEAWPEGIPYLESVWQTVVDSLRFFTPWE